MNGRTTWWPKDAAWHRRERQVQIGLELGADALHVLDVISSWAQEQRTAEGYVRGGFMALAHEAFVDVDRVRKIVGFATSIGALDDLELDRDGRRFTCRVSGWEADTRRGIEAIRKAEQRAQAADLAHLSQANGTSPTETGRVPQTKPNQTKPKKETNTAAYGSIVAGLFAYWQEQTKHPTAKLTDDRRARVETRLREGYTPEQIRQAIDGAARGAFVNDTGKRFDDIELICRTGSKLEGFIERASSTASGSSSNRRPSVSDLLREINA